jgi:hypothetical protein
MLRRKPYTIVVCLAFFWAALATGAHAYSIIQAAAATSPEDIIAPLTPKVKDAAQAQAQAKRIVKVRPIEKCRPPLRIEGPMVAFAPFLAADCVLPQTRDRGWEVDAEVMYARAKGHVRFYRGAYTYGYYGQWMDDVDLNTDLGLDDHRAIPTFTARYKLRPNWSIRYSFMPMLVEGSGDGICCGRAFGRVQGTGYGYGYGFGGSRSKWERYYHRLGLVYDPIKTHRARISVFGDYVRLDEKISLIPGGYGYGYGYGGDAFDHSLNMGMAGLEFERCLKTGRYCNTLSLECKAGVAFLDEAFGSDLSTGVKYLIPMGNGRWGYMAGGYRFLTYKKGYSDAMRIDTALEGGYLKMGLVF